MHNVLNIAEVTGYSTHVGSYWFSSPVFSSCNRDISVQMSIEQLEFCSMRLADRHCSNEWQQASIYVEELQHIQLQLPQLTFKREKNKIKTRLSLIKSKTFGKKKIIFWSITEKHTRPWWIGEAVLPCPLLESKFKQTPTWQPSVATEEVCLSQMQISKTLQNGM